MALVHFMLLCSFLIYSQVCSMPTKCIIRWDLVESSHNLLENMGGLFPRECLEEKVEITFPKSALQSNGSNQKIAVYTIMEHIDSLFANETHPGSWVPEKVDVFRHKVYRLKEDNKCVLGKTHGPVDDFPAIDNALRNYFEELATLLRNKDYSFCAWEVVRKELLSVLNDILQLNSSK
ncbi:interferon alpha-13-like [Myxocyprinus asiaticus]|uniref:interferon alpha-13-like n=1 Tax=Myxocyprinus asiaticus TaxID=70543 RepID=UPI00222393F5|nr:interferon alpha-13-like [Myxocyprinus asiaticus]XP_051570719.1 interferon alpha-13-like [Myxocyprinus asiaticus]